METRFPEDLGFSSERLARIGEALRRYIDGGHIAGMTTLVARRGQVVHAQAHGFMDREAERPMTMDAIMRIFSMTKPIASVAAMMLYEEGRFTLETPVAQFLPELSQLSVYTGGGPDSFQTVPLDRPITMHHLLTHTSGLAYGLDRSHPVEAMMQDWRARQKRQLTLPE